MSATTDIGHRGSVPTVAGQSLSVAIDEADGECLGTAVVVPPFATTARNLFAAAHLLTSNGVRTVRFDPRDHVGASPGQIGSFRLSTLVDDIGSVLDANSGPKVLVAFSVSARPALRALVGRDDLMGAVLVTPVVDVRSSLAAILGSDLFGLESHQVPPAVELLGSTVSRGFLDDCLASGMIELGDAADDAGRALAPLRFLAGDDDPWVDVDQVREVARLAAAAGADTQVGTIAAASHRLNRNPAVAMRYLGATTVATVSLLGGDGDLVHIPPFADLIDAAHRRSRRATRSSDQTPNH